MKTRIFVSNGTGMYFPGCLVNIQVGNRNWNGETNSNGICELETDKGQAFIRVTSFANEIAFSANVPCDQIVHLEN
jgi:hypothetical protein